MFDRSRDPLISLVRVIVALVIGFFLVGIAAQIVLGTGSDVNGMAISVVAFGLAIGILILTR